MSTEHNTPAGGDDAAGQLAHELANLLDAAGRNLDLARAILPDVADMADAQAERADERLMLAGESIRRMGALLKRWMATARRDDDARLYWQDVTLGEAIHVALRLIEPTADARNIMLCEYVPTDVAVLPAGPLGAVLINALKNALDAVPDGGRIEVHAERHNGHATLHVSDDGAGIPDDLPRDPDGLPHPGTTTKPHGHGLGLAACRRIAHALGGSIQLESAPGQGTVVTVRWPVDAIQSQHENKHDASPASHEVQYA